MQSFHPPRLFRSIVLLFALLFTVNAQAADFCQIDVVDAENGWPVPQVELRTVHNVRFFSDNAGVIAFDLPELFNVQTWFFVSGNGYEVPKDGFGYQGVRLTPKPGGKLTVKVNRQLPGKRLGRLTGAGIFGESQKLGLEKKWTEQGMLGCDSVQIAEHNGKFYWAWGDTALAHYPLGLFHMLSATTSLKPLDSFKPPLRLRYDYFRDDKGTVRNVAEMPGEGPTWVSGYISLPDKNGKQHLVGTYMKVKPPMTAYESGLCVWDEEKEVFEQHQVLWTLSDKSPEPPLAPDGHPTLWTDSEGKKVVLFGDPFPRLQCPATFEAWENPKTWQSLEPQKAVPSADGKESISPHRGSIAWNAYRQKWITVFTQMGGKPSMFGELWYAEADHPIGPWGGAIKVVTHSNYTFYNPRLHPEFTSDKSPILLFEATLSQMFANKPNPVPRHDYNQVLYRIDLDDPAFSKGQAERE